MLKRLLTAVLVLGLFLALSGTAFCGTVPNEVNGKVTSSVYQSKLHAPGDLLPINFTSHPSKTRVVKTDNTTVTPRPGSASVDTVACYSQDYYVGATTAVRADLYDAAGPYDEQLASRYDVFNAPNYVADVQKIWVVVRFASHLGGPGCPIRLHIWSDAGGMPATELYAQDFVIPARIAAATWMSFTLPTPFTVTGTYHVSVGNGSTAAPGDSLAIRFLYDGTVSGRGTYAIGPTFYPFATVWGVDGDPMLATEQCEHYTECYWNSPFGGNLSLYLMPRTWSPSGIISDGFAQRFTSVGPETLKTVTVYNYSLPGYYTGSSTNSFKVSVWPDDGTGNLDTLAGPYATVTLPPGAGLFPNTGIGGTGWNFIDVDFSSFNVVVRGAYHLAVQVTSSNGADGKLIFATSREDGSPSNNDQSGASINHLAPGNQWHRTGIDAIWTGSGRPEVGYLVDGYLCKDEFAKCKTQASYEVGFVNRLLYMDNCNIPPTYGTRIGIAGHFTGEQVNRVEKVRFQMGDETIDGAPDVPNSVRVTVFSSSGGQVGTPVWSTVLTNAQITMLPGWTEVVIPGGVQVLDDWFVGVEPLPTLDGDQEWYYFARERVGDPGVTGQPGNGMFVKLCADGLWYQNNTIASADNFICEADFCSIPPSEWSCGAADDYATNSHDFGRTGHSNVSLSDAYCDLNTIWHYADAGLGNQGVGGGAPTWTTPIIYNDYVVCAFNSKFNILDLNTGALVATLSGNAAPYFVNVNGVRCNPTIADVAGTPVLFYGGGTTNGQFAAVKMVPPFDTLWTLTNSNRVAKGYAVTLGNTSYSAPVVANGMVYFNTNDGKVWAADALTGNKVWGPTTLVAGSFRNLAFDGTNLYAATIANPPTFMDGDVYAINAMTGAIVWQLSTAGGLKPQTPTDQAQIFPDQLAVYDGVVFTVGCWQILPTAPDEGLFYRIKADNGAVLSFTATGHTNETGSALTIGSNLIVDAKRVMVVGGNLWTSVPQGGTIIAYNRYTGGKDYATYSGPIGGGTGVYLGNPAMSCEPGGADLLIAGDSRGYLSFFNADDGSEIFHRRIDNAQAGWVSQWGGVAIGKNGTVVAVDRVGNAYGLAKGVDRPRLEITQYSMTYPVPYGSPASTIVTFPGLLVNTGCAPLTGTMNFLAASNGSTLGAAGTGYAIAERVSSIADRLASNDATLMKNMQPAVFNADEITVDSKSMMNRAASAAPIFLNPPFSVPFTINPGDSAAVVLDVNGPLINRGSNVMYAEFTSNDPDFFLDQFTQVPQVQINLVGGCLIDTTTLKFGVGGANYHWATNTGRLGTGDWTPHGFSISGNIANFYQGTYVMGVSKSRLAMNSQDWASGGGEDDAWKSLQGDPNQCNGDCKPALLTGVNLGQISATGSGYTSLTGNMVCRQYIDSVQNFDQGGWDWTNFTAGFDQDSSMGVKVVSKIFGAKDVPAPFTQLNSVVVDYMKVSQRYDLPLVGWKFGAIIDYDIGGDTANIDQSISTAWSYTPGAATGNAWGLIKIPFGPGYAPMKNVKAMDADQAQFNNDAGCRGNCYWDSCYTYMSQAACVSQTVTTAPQDQEFHATIAEHDFVAGPDVYEFAVAHFGLLAVTAPNNGANYAPLAKLVNQWMGFGRGDVNNDGALNLADIIYLADNVAGSGPGPIPFAHLGDVNADGASNMADVTYLVNYYFHYGPAPVGKFIEY